MANRVEEIDYSKIIALHNAGWSGSKIADEMRMSNDEYYNILINQLEHTDKKINRLEHRYKKFSEMLMRR